MLKRVATSDIELGMFIHKLEGSWFKHPFWKAKFLLEDPQTLDVLQDSEVESVIIDTERGLDVRPVQREATSGDVVRPIRRAPPARPRVAPLAQINSTNSVFASGIPAVKEFGNARKSVARAGKVVSRVFLEARLGRSIGISDVEPVIEEVYASIQRNLYAFNGLLRCREDNEYVYRHSLAVSALMIALGRQLRLSPSEIREAGMAGLLMDIGVAQLPVDLGPSGDYRELSQDLLDQHVVLGYSLLKAAGGLPERVLNCCLHHHERLDGSGYPNHLSSDQLGVFERMAVICDTYDNLVSGSAKEPALDPAEAIRRMNEMGGSVDQEVMRAFIEAVGVYPIGSFVRLRSERLAMVIDGDPTDNSKPTVRTFHSLALDKRIRGETIVLSRCYGEDDIVGVADMSVMTHAQLAELRASILTQACRDDG